MKIVDFFTIVAAIATVIAIIFPVYENWVSFKARKKQKITGYLNYKVILAKQYLKPGLPLKDSNRIIERTIKFFKNRKLKIKPSYLEPYIISDQITRRVAGYIGFQICPSNELLDYLLLALELERVEAKETQETRSLWRLLVCFTKYCEKYKDRREDVKQIRKALEDHLQFLKSNFKYIDDKGVEKYIDKGGECKKRIGELLAEQL